MVMNLKNIFFVFLFTVSLAKTFAQQTNPFPANALTASTYNGDDKAKANYYTGQPNISFPLFNYQGADLAVDMSIAYNATGTTVNQLASSVGLGWSLSSYGVVKRFVVGTPDEFYYIKNYAAHFSGYLNTVPVSLTPTRAELDDFYNSKKDGEADDFYFSIPGYSGKILIDKYSQVVGTIPKSNLVITLDRTSNSGRIYKFKIKTESGLTYEFSREELLKYRTKIDNVDYDFDYTSTWLLTYIYPSVGNTVNNIISFDYEPYYSNEIIGREYFYSSPTNPNITGALASVCVASGGACCLSVITHANKDHKIDGTLQRLLQINIPNGSKIVFNYKSSMRCDLAYEKALDNISLINSKDLTEKKIEFNYAYVGASGEVAYNSCSSLDLNKRLILKSIIESGSDGSFIPPYEFEYEMGTVLPARNVTSNDEWGYFTNTNYPESYKAYILKKIKYPTGSFTSYEYEPNVIGWTKSLNGNQTIGGIRLKKIISNEGTVNPTYGEQPIEMIYTYELPNNVSSGEVDYKPIKTFTNYLNINAITPSCQLGGSYDYNNVMMTNYLNYSIFPRFPTGNVCGYSRVTEEIKSGSQSLGKTVYTFKNFSNYINNNGVSGSLGEMNFPFPNKSYNVSWALGLPFSIEKYNSDGKILEKTESAFNVESYRVNNSDLAAIKVGLWYGPTTRSSSAANGDVYKYESYYPLSGRTTLAQSSKFDYTYKPSAVNADIISMNETYETLPDKNLLRSKSSYDTKGNLIKTIYYYPFDYSLANPGSSAIPVMNANNIITPVISQEVWITKNGVNYLIDAFVQDYIIISNGTIKPSKKFGLKKNGLIPESSIPLFNSGSLFRDANLFEEISNVSNYNSIGSATQIYNKVYQVNSLIYGYNNTLPTAEITNAKITEVAFAGFEDITSYIGLNSFSTGNFLISGIVNNSSTISGRKSFTGQLSTVLSSGTYNISYWSSSNNPVTPTGATILQNPQLVKMVDGWYLFKGVLNIPNPTGNVILNSGGSFLDDVRIYPTKAIIKTYNYNTQLLKSSVSNNNNSITYSYYDGFGRLSLVLDENKNVVSRSCIKYDGQVGNCIIYKNVEKSGVFVRSNCIDGGGSSVPYIVPQGTYFSTFSQAHADQQAQAEVDLNGYLYANIYGTCPTASQCDPNNCTGVDKKCINGVCETGQINIVSTRKVKVIDPNFGFVWKFYCTWYYCWSDGSTSAPVEYETAGLCFVQSC